MHDLTEQSQQGIFNFYFDALSGQCRLLDDEVSRVGFSLEKLTETTFQHAS